MNSSGRGVFDPSVPNIARVMDYLDGGKDNFAVDRVLADRLLEITPEVPILIGELRKFVRKAIAYLAGQGIRQFVDIGCGLPTCGSVHEILQELDVRGTVVYLDEDPVVVAHGQAILSTYGRSAGPDAPLTRVIRADPRDPGALLSRPELTELIDFAEPTAFLVRTQLALLDDPEATALMESLIDRLAPGGHLLISHIVRDPAEARTDEMTRLFKTDEMFDGDRDRVRTRAQVAGLLKGLDLVSPGLVPLPAWRPVFGEPAVDPETFLGVGALGRKP
ncbi:SAM-dependent methyltransferase [Actinocorallia longicatena]|uniref:SAM-dependent methyltransferase n=1 Tax=Actinocorallia longicatena TaxID=111803 RepID=A0ABP6PX38_9ACTN